VQLRRVAISNQDNSQNHEFAHSSGFLCSRRPRRLRGICDWLPQAENGTFLVLIIDAKASLLWRKTAKVCWYFASWSPRAKTSISVYRSMDAATKDREHDWVNYKLWDSILSCKWLVLFVCAVMTGFVAVAYHQWLHLKGTSSCSCTKSHLGYFIAEILLYDNSIVVWLYTAWF
jgi:hypothetical protein